jgi:hypothetical protein
MRVGINVPWPPMPSYWVGIAADLGLVLADEKRLL